MSVIAGDYDSRNGVGMTSRNMMDDCDQAS